MTTDAQRAWLNTGLVIALASISLGAIYWSTVHSMIAIWTDAETYSHGFLILPISLWLAWRDRQDLLAEGPRPAVAVSVLVLGAAGVWWLAQALGVQVGAQLALVAMLVGVIWSLVGHRAARVLVFPLLFLFLMVPMGEGLVEPMMEFTADFTVGMLEMTGIPVYREGLNFVVPSGNWSVVEACSGVRYLIASVTLGLLYAYLTYRSLWRRALFVALSVALPVLANGIRAYLIVMIGHLSNMKLAVGVDHLIYGWVFFGMVMLLLFWVGGFWAEPASPTRPTVARPTGAPAPLAMVGVAVVVLTAAALPRLVQHQTASQEQVAELAAPAQAGPWQKLSKPATAWPWQLHDAHQVVTASYRKDEATVTLVAAVFTAQRQGHEVISSNNMLLGHGSGGWRSIRRSGLTLPLSGGRLQVPAYELTRHRGNLLTEAAERLLVVHWYRLGTYAAADPYIGKLRQAQALILDQRRDGIWVALATQGGAGAADRLAAFAGEALPAIWGGWDGQLAGD